MSEQHITFWAFMDTMKSIISDLKTTYKDEVVLTQRQPKSLNQNCFSFCPFFSSLSRKPKSSNRGGNF